MPKKSMTSEIPMEKPLSPFTETKSVTPAQTAKLAGKVVYAPTSSQAQVKAQFWHRFQPGPMATLEDLTLAKAIQITQCNRLRDWWSQPGFLSWFLNKDEAREKMHYLFNQGLDALQEILMNPEANANAKVNSVKLLAEMTGYLTKKPVERFADDEINSMSKEQVQKYLASRGIKVVQENIIDTTSGSKKDGRESDSEAAQGESAESASGRDNSTGENV